MKEDITLIGVVLALLLGLPILIAGAICIFLVALFILFFDFIDYIKK